MIGAIVGFIVFLCAWTLLDDMFLWPIALIIDIVLWVVVAKLVESIIAKQRLP